MIFTLEALEANQGDSLILHYGPADRPRFLIIDGGPDGVYESSLRPRLEQLHDRWKRDDDEKLDLEMVMVSHIDDDHIAGIISFVKEIQSGDAPPCNIRTIWYNSFDHVLGDAADTIRAHVATIEQNAAASGAPESWEAFAVVSSVRQGRELRERVDALGVPLNGGFDGLVMLDQSRAASDTAALPEGLTLRVIAPLKKRIDKLRKEWEDDVRRHPDPVVVAAFADRSVPNLSSIVVVAEFAGKRMLLTGDARGNDISEGLQSCGLLDSAGAAHFDVMKMPHHGSSRNVTLEWLEKITADHYVISADGQYGNPDADTIEWICRARDGQSFSVEFTNENMMNPKDGSDVGEAVRKVFDKMPNNRRTVLYGAPRSKSVRADLLDPVRY
jgi:hypothetical protein